MMVGSRFAEEGLNALGISDESDAVRKRITSRRNSEVTRVKTRLMGIALIAGICVPVAFAASDAASPAPTSGAATYSARTDQRVEPYPKNPPPLGPAGSVIKDPSFDSRILRVTDAKSDRDRAGTSFHTPSSAEQNSFNTTSTKFYVIVPGGRLLLYDFDPANLAARAIGVPNLTWRGEPVFSFAQPNLLYGIAARGAAFQQYDLSNSKVTTIHDPADCMKLDATVSGYAISVDAQDQRFASVLGPQQDKNNLVYVYDRNKGCRWYNTQTGEISGKWGSKGNASVADRFLMHNARMSKSGAFIYITTAGKWLIWEVDSLNVTICDPRAHQCGGHRALGYSHMLNPSGRGHPMDLLVRPLNRVTEFSPLVRQLPANGSWFDKHISWNNVDPQDTNPACLSTYRRDNPSTPGAPLQVSGPWENEIDCVEMDGKASKVWRFAHTYSTAQNGFWSTPRGNVSQDGRFFMFTSDWEDQLGQEPNGRGYRTDVFIVELR
jgi:hypothetical protein